MSENKFSKGNWKQGKQTDSVITDDPDMLALETEDSINYYGGSVICESARTVDIPLLSASKDLLEACEKAINLLPLWGCLEISQTISKQDEGELQALHQMELTLKAAISKAIAIK